MKLIERGLIGMVLLLLIFLAIYRVLYGIWNPFVPPDRVDCYGSRYYVSHNSPVVFAESERPCFLIHSPNLLMGKRLYSKYSGGEFVPTIIYLYIGNAKYQIYELSGGP